MLPPGHLAAGVIIGARRSRRSARHPAWPIAAGVTAAIVPDLDVFIPPLLDRLGVAHDLDSGVHHRWVTHTPLFWGLAGILARRLARRPATPSWAAGAADMLALAVAVHLVQDSVANTVALLWPFRRREYGLGLDGLAGVTDHAEYARRYPSSSAGVLEAGLVVLAFVHGRRALSGEGRRSRPGPWPGTR